MPNPTPETTHQHLLERAPRILRYDIEDYFPEWQSAVRRSFKQLLGLMPARIPINVQILSQEESPDHRAIHFLFAVETGATIKALLRLPHGVNAKPPLVIWLSAGEFSEPLKGGVAVLTFDLRDAGSRKIESGADNAMTALLLGRTMIGERIFDISRAIDAVTDAFPDLLDTTKIAIAGPALAYYACAFEPRITAVMCTGVAFFKDTLAIHPHPTEAYIPNLLHYFEMSDLAGIICPRPLLIVAGEQNPLYPLESVQSCFSEIETLYKNQNLPQTCQLITSSNPIPPTALWNTFKALLH